MPEPAGQHLQRRPDAATGDDVVSLSASPSNCSSSTVTGIVAEEPDAEAQPERLPVLIHRQTVLAVAVQDAEADGTGASDDVRTTTHVLITRLAMSAAHMNRVQEPLFTSVPTDETVVPTSGEQVAEEIFPLPTQGPRRT
ncbi:hypothetical protein [Streptomyces sp. NPDC089919]|uniref:hypothetical protein n=1 Tax=Streptomyces sp. NPDC089919 TaxID=3155188 RepID=UPI003424E702